MNLYAEYLKEKDNIEYIEVQDKGFCTYLDQGECYYIVDIYVIPSLRKHNIASMLADKVAEIAKKEGKKFLLGAIEADSKAEEVNEKVLESYGFRYSHYNEEDEISYYIKEIC